MPLAATPDNQLWAIEVDHGLRARARSRQDHRQGLLINAAEDEANPPRLGAVERTMKRIRRGGDVMIPAGPKTHGHFTHFYAEMWKPHLIEFVKTLGGPLQAAACIPSRP